MCICTRRTCANEFNPLIKSIARAIAVRINFLFVIIISLLINLNYQFLFFIITNVLPFADTHHNFRSVFLIETLLQAELEFE